ncbi:MAG: alpha/beta hydrolase [Planctomycetota bacterium]
MLVFVAGVLAAEPSQAKPLFEQRQNVVYGESHGVGLVMDVFVPTGPKNGLGIIDVVSGSYFSTRQRIDRHKYAGVFDTLCRRGFTVFAIRPGSQPRFVIPEMVTHVQQGIRWVKEHAKDYQVDPERLGLIGASAGGHLACLAVMTAAAGTEDKGSVAAVGVFFPPTDFLDWGTRKFDVDNVQSVPPMVQNLAMNEKQRARLSADEQFAALANVCPARIAHDALPPFLIIHGTNDLLVPFQQSEKLHGVLREAGVPCELLVMEKTGHGYDAMKSRMSHLADWLDNTLGNAAKNHGP